MLNDLAFEIPYVVGMCALSIVNFWSFTVVGLLLLSALVIWYRHYISKKNTEKRVYLQLRRQDDKQKDASSTLCKVETTKTAEDMNNTEALDWDYNPDSRTLTISGKGNMPDGWRPWPSNLKVDKVVIKNGVLSISDKAFEGMSIKRIEFGETLLSIGSKILPGVIDGDVVRFPKYLRNVGNSAFGGFSAHKVIIIFGDKIEKIGKEALGCGSLGHCEVRFKSNNPPIVENGLLFSIDRGCSIKVPKGCYKQYISSPSFANYVNVIREMDIEEMDLSTEDIKKQEEEHLKAKRRRENEERQRVEEEEFRARVEAELRKKMGL